MYLAELSPDCLAALALYLTWDELVTLLFCGDFSLTEKLCSTSGVHQVTVKKPLNLGSSGAGLIKRFKGLKSLLFDSVTSPITLLPEYQRFRLKELLSVCSGAVHLDFCFQEDVHELGVVHWANRWPNLSSLTLVPPGRFRRVENHLSILAAQFEHFPTTLAVLDLVSMTLEETISDSLSSED